MNKDELKQFIEDLIKHADMRKLEATSACQKSWIRGYVYASQKFLELVEGENQ